MMVLGVEALHQVDLLMDPALIQLAETGLLLKFIKETDVLRQVQVV